LEFAAKVAPRKGAKRTMEENFILISSRVVAFGGGCSHFVKWWLDLDLWES
jgi:hypothetical protein